MKRRRACIAKFFLFLFIAGMMGSGLWMQRVFAKADTAEIIKLSDRVRPDYSYLETKTIAILTILDAAKAKVTVNFEELDPDEDQFHEYDYSEYAKASKKLFGKVLKLTIPHKTKGEGLFYNPKTKTIYRQEYYDPGDVMTRRNRKDVKKIGKNTYLVENLDSSHYPLFLDKRPTKKTSVTIKKRKNGYIITKIKVENYNGKKLKLGKKDNLNYISKIKKWYAKPTKEIEKKSFKHEGKSYIVMKHKHNIIFIYEADGNNAKRFYFKDGVPVRVLVSEASDNTETDRYDLYYKGGEAVVNDGMLADQDEIMNIFAEADSQYYLVDIGVIK